MNISERLKNITDICPVLRTWGDIGADHGLTSANLILSGKAGRVIATDISADSLKKAEPLLLQPELSGKLELACGDGLRPLDGKGVDGAVISGMGGPLIVSILENDIDIAASLKFLVLSPNSYPERLRAFITSNGFVTERERMVCDRGKYYPVMLVHQGICEPYSDSELYLGRNMQKDDCYLGWCKCEAERWQIAAERAGGKNARAEYLHGLFCRETVISQKI